MMPAGPEDTILVVDDEESVRQTFRDWLESADLNCRVLAAEDAESALIQANRNAIDLAILDWHLGAGHDGLRLLEDLYLFNPDIVAIMITGFAQQATPLDAMRMGVRDYLDKNQDLDRASFLAAVSRQLERIRPAKRERKLHASLAAFREAVEKTLPLVQSAAALNEPVPLPEAVRSLFRFLIKTTGAQDGIMLVRSVGSGAAAAEEYRAYHADGSRLEAAIVPSSRSVAGMVISLQEPYAVRNPDRDSSGGAIELQPFELHRQSILAAPMIVGSDIQVVIELFDKLDPAGRPMDFTASDTLLIGAAAEFGTEMLRQALSAKQTHELLLDAVSAALEASDRVSQSLRTGQRPRQDEPLPAEVIERLRQGLAGSPSAPVHAESALRLAEAVRVLAIRHGPQAVAHCISLVESLGQLLDGLAGGLEASK